jgi:hypothetical protein
LKIKCFLGTSRNAVLTQIWVAMYNYLLLSYIKYQTKCSYSLLELTWIFSGPYAMEFIVPLRLRGKNSVEFSTPF